MSGKDKTETGKKPKLDVKKDDLERELEDTFPASDPPSTSQPSSAGSPERKDKTK